MHIFNKLKKKGTKIAVASLAALSACAAVGVCNVPKVRAELTTNKKTWGIFHYQDGKIEYEKAYTKARKAKGVHKTKVPKSSIVNSYIKKVLVNTLPYSLVKCSGKGDFKAEAVGGSMSRWRNTTIHPGKQSQKNAKPYEALTYWVVKDGKHTNPAGIGVYYKKAFNYCDNSYKKKPQQLDVKLSVVKYQSAATGKKHNLRLTFHKDAVAVSHEPYTTVYYRLQFFDSQTHAEVHPKIGLSFRDIDFGQSISMGSQYTHIIGYRDKHNVALSPGTYGDAKYILYGDRTNYDHKVSPYKSGLFPSGSVNDDDPWGGITYDISKGSNYIIRYSVNSNVLTTGPNNHGHSIQNASDFANLRNNKIVKPSNTIHSKVQNNGAHNVQTHGNLFKILDDTWTPPTPTIKDKKISFTKTIPTSEKSWHESNKSKPIKVDPKHPEKTAFNIRLRASGPWHHTVVGKGKARYTAKLFRFGDCTIPNCFDIDTKKIRLYTQTTENGPMHRTRALHGSYAKTGNSKGKAKNHGVNGTIHIKKVGTDYRVYFEAKNVKSGAAGNQQLFNHLISIVVPVHGNKKLPGLITHKEGKNKYTHKFANLIFAKDDVGTPPATGIYIYVYSRTKGSPATVGPTEGHKDVYRLLRGKHPSNKNSDWDWESYDNGTVFPGQYLTYRLHFKMSKVKQGNHNYTRYKTITIKDKLDTKHIDRLTNDKGEAKGSPNVYVGQKPGARTLKVKPTGNFTVKLDLKNKKQKAFVNKMSKSGGDLWLQYTVKLKDNKPGKGEKVINSAQLTATKQKTNQAHQQWVGQSEPKTTTDSQGNTHTTPGTKVRKDIWTFKGHEKIKKDVADILGHTPPDGVPSQTTATAKDGKTIKLHYDHDVKKCPGWVKDDNEPVKAKTNKTHNPFEETPQPHEQEKTFVPKKDYVADEVTLGTEGDFEINVTLPTLNEDCGDFKGFTYTDDVNKKYYQINGQPHLEPADDSDSKDVPGKVSVSGNTATWKITKEEAKKFEFKGQVIKFIIPVKPLMRKKLIVHEFKNQAKSTWIFPGPPMNLTSDKLIMDPEDKGESIAKTIVGIRDDYKTADHSWQSGQETVMKPNDPYTVHYHLDVDLGNEEELGSFKISDQLPEHASFDKSSVQIKVDRMKGYGEWDYDQGNGGLQPSFEGDDKMTISGSGKQWYFTEIHIDYNAKIKPEADWSDYYNSKTKNGQAKYNNGLDHITDSSYLMIPNSAHLQVGGQSLSTSASFNMGAQTLAVKQLIVQDDDKWSDNLDPSHYLPHTRNDRSAVTTAIRIRMPNYLKLDSTTFMNEAKTAGFDKGQVHTLRANLDLVHDEKLLKNPDFTQSGYAKRDPYVGEWNQNVTGPGSGVGSDAIAGPGDNLQNTAGKVFYRFQKWAPKTKFWRDYAKLGNMRTGFKANMHMKAHSVGNRQADSMSPQLSPEQIDKDYPTNDVAIHLSNIYRYITKIDDSRYYDDGKKFDYRVFGEAKGLAVDKEHKTDFSSAKEGQPISAWISQNEMDYMHPAKDKKTLPIRDQLGQGETYDTYARWSEMPTDKYVGKNIVHGYQSDSALTEVKGHSVTLTSDLTDDIKHLDVNNQHGQGLYDTGKKAQPLDNQTLADIRFDNDIHYEKIKNQVINKANSTYTNPREYREYYDFNRQFDGKDLSRTFKEAYEMFARDQIRAHAGYGIVDTHKLEVFGYYDDHDPKHHDQYNNDHKSLLNHYKTNLSSPDKIFDDGYIANANSEYLDLTHLILGEKRKNDIDGALQIQRNHNASVDDLIDARTGNMPLGIASEKWADQYQTYVDTKNDKKAYFKGFESIPKEFNVQRPVYRLNVINYRFNKRLLKQGRQVLDPGHYDSDVISKDPSHPQDSGVYDQRRGDLYNAYPNDNKNKPGFENPDSSNKGTLGVKIDGYSSVEQTHYRNYIKNWVKPGQYNLNFKSQDFGVGNAISMKYTQTLGITGHRYLSEDDKKHADSSNQDEINIQPAMSGKDAQTINGSKKVNAWLKNNDPNQKKVVK